MRHETSTDVTSYSATPTEDPSTPLIESLRDPVRTKEKLNLYFPNWNDALTCHKLPFCTDLNPASYKTEVKLYNYLCSLNEPMVIIHNYQHNEKVKGGYQMGVLDVGEGTKVSQIDLLVIHMKYGILPFEVKDMQNVTVIGSADDSGPSTINKKLCSVGKIKKGEDQLVKLWQDIDKYVRDFFKIKVETEGDEVKVVDEQLKQKWADYWKIDVRRLEKILDDIAKNSTRRSFLCLFNCDKPTTANTFSCKEKSCTEEHISEHVVLKAEVLTNEILHSETTFQNWWKRMTVDLQTESFDLMSYEFLLNRFGLDYFLSEFIVKSLDISAAAEEVDAKTANVRRMFDPNMVVKRKLRNVKIMWSKIQKKILLTAKLAFIIGPPGSGKTILMVEKVRSLLRKMDDSKGEDNRILILCSGSESLKDMLKKSRDYLKLELESGKLMIFTKKGLDEWMKGKKGEEERKRNQTKLSPNHRFRHIFIDESQELSLKALTNFFKENLSEEYNDRHFWILRDASRTRTGYNNKDFRVNDIFTSATPEDCPPAVFYLKYIFRCTQRQCVLFLPFMKQIMCTHCRQLRIDGEGKFICHYCQPWYALDIPGPEPLFLPLLDNVPGRMLKKFMEFHAKAVMEAFVEGWEKFFPDCPHKNYGAKLMYFFYQGLFGRTTVLLKIYADLMRIELKNYLKGYELDRYVCSAVEFYSQDEDEQRKFLRVENYDLFKGLECHVAIVYDPDVKADFQRFDFNAVSFSRANCLNIIITDSARKQQIEDIMKNASSQLLDTVEQQDQNIDVEKYEASGCTIRRLGPLLLDYGRK